MKREETPVLKETRTLFETPYINIYDLIYEDGLHYFDASRRKPERLAAWGAEEKLPDAVSGFVILTSAGREPRFLLFREYRYPVGHYVLSIPSGLIDEKDRQDASPILSAMRRELAEETGIHVSERDRLDVVNPLAFNSPGLTDESTALVACVIDLPDDHALSQSGAEGTERFAGFDLVTVAEAKEILRRGCDEDGKPFPLVTWAGLMFFVSGMWEE